MTNEIGRSRKQRVFAKIETTKGELIFPDALDVILPAGNAVMNQSPAFTDSEELNASLDTLSQFQDAMPPGSFEIPTYLRPAGTLGCLPQADALFQSMQGSRNAATTASLSASLSTAGDTLTFDTLAGGKLPQKGTIQIGSELIYYGSYTKTTTTTGTLGDLTRGYNSTTPASVATNGAISLKSVWYPQTTSAPCVSVWIESDHFVQGMSGGAVQSGVLGVNKSGAVSWKFTGQGMAMVYAGTSTMKATASSGASVITVDHPKNYKAGARIQNTTAEDTNGNVGYEIAEVCVSTDEIFLTETLDEDWTEDDVVKGFLPLADAIGTPVESRYTTITIDDVSAKFKTTEIQFGVPKKPIDDEVGTTYIEEFVDDKRDISTSFNIYFREQDGAYFTDGYESNASVVSIVFGTTVGLKQRVHFKNAQLSVPTVSHNPPTIELNMELKCKGTSGEDSAEIIFE